MSDTDSDYEQMLNIDQTWNTEQKRKYCFLSACYKGNLTYVKENYKFNDMYINKGLSRACKNKQKDIIEFLINKGAYNCKNCQLANNKKICIITPFKVFTRKYKSYIVNHSEKTFGEIASIMVKKWKDVQNDEFEFSKFKLKALYVNQKKLKCLE